MKKAKQQQFYSGEEVLKSYIREYKAIDVCDEKTEAPTRRLEAVAQQLARTVRRLPVSR